MIIKIVGEIMFKLMAQFVLILLVLVGCSSGFQKNDSEEGQGMRTLDNLERNSINTEGIVQLSFDDFKDRWNSLVEEQMSELAIQSLEGITVKEERYYRAMLTNQIELRVFEDQHTVQKLEIHSYGTSPSDRRQMLTAWSHVIQMMQTVLDVQDVDGLFHEFGVGPNFDVSNVKEKAIMQNGIIYEIFPTEQGFIFKATYERTT